MSTTQHRKVVHVDKNGVRLEFNDDEAISVETTINATCDNPTCGTIHGKPGPTTFSWVMEKAQSDRYAIPDAQYHGASFAFFQQPTKWFCSRLCHKDGTREWNPPLSPKEQEQIEAACAAVDKAKVEEP